MKKEYDPKTDLPPQCILMTSETYTKLRDKTDGEGKSALSYLEYYPITIVVDEAEAVLYAITSNKRCLYLTF